MSLRRWRTWRQQWFVNALYSAGYTKNKHRGIVSNGPILPLSLSSTKSTAAHIFRLPEPSIMSTTLGFKPATGLILTGNSDYKGTEWRSLNFIERGLQNFQVYETELGTYKTDFLFFNQPTFRTTLNLRSSASWISKSSHHSCLRNTVITPKMQKMETYGPDGAVANRPLTLTYLQSGHLLHHAGKSLFWTLSVQVQYMNGYYWN